MQVSKAAIRKVVAEVRDFSDIEVVINGGDFLVIAETVNHINEFEVRFVESITPEDESQVNTYIDLIENRELRRRYNGECQARYNVTLL